MLLTFENDLFFGHALAEAPQLTPEQAALVAKLIRKYRQQLEGRSA